MFFVKGCGFEVYRGKICLEICLCPYAGGSGTRKIKGMKLSSGVEAIVDCM